MIYFYANDSTGNLNNSYVLRLHRDIRNPEITIINPNFEDLFGGLYLFYFQRDILFTFFVFFKWNAHFVNDSPENIIEVDF